MSNVLIIGLNHQVQLTEIQSIGEEPVSFEKKQKEMFGQMLTRICTERGVDFIGEEALHLETVAQRIAQSLQLRYENIDMTRAERSTKNIPKDYSGNDSPYSPEQIAKWHQEREQFMFEKARQYLCFSNNILILCGRTHTNGLARLFQEAGHTVETSDVNQEDWYIEDWQAHLLS